MTNIFIRHGEVENPKDIYNNSDLIK